MAKYIIKRILYLLLTLWVIITVTFLLMHAVPGGPFTDGDRGLPPAVERALAEKYNLTDPLPVQYLNFMKGLLRFDLGPSYAYEGRSVGEIIRIGFPVTFTLALVYMVMVITLGIPLGVIAALYRNRAVDKIIMFTATIGRTLPSFVKATLLLFFFSFVLGWFPIYGVHEGFRSYFLPALALSLSSIAYMARVVRSTMLDVLGQDYMRTANAKGLKRMSVLYKHGLRNASIPIVTILGENFAAALTGSFVIEKIFALPGIGRYFVTAVGNRDYTTIMGVTIFSSVIALTMVLLVDISYGLLDPRIRIEKKRGSA